MPFEHMTMKVSNCGK